MLMSFASFALKEGTKVLFKDYLKKVAINTTGHVLAKNINDQIKKKRKWAYLMPVISIMKGDA